MTPKVYRMYSPGGNKRGVNKREDGIFEKKSFCENTKKRREMGVYFDIVWPPFTKGSSTFLNLSKRVHPDFCLDRGQLSERGSNTKKEGRKIFTGEQSKCISIR